MLDLDNVFTVAGVLAGTFWSCLALVFICALVLIVKMEKEH